MNIENNMVFFEVNKILCIIGEEYISKLPNGLYQFIKESSEKAQKYDYGIISSLDITNIKRKATALITLFNLNYWCETNEEKIKLCKILKNNTII